jgi:hypothetical protein
MARSLRKSLTIRLTSPLRKKLSRRAQQLNETPSEFVRSLLEHELGETESDDQPTLYELTRRWVGAVSSGDVPAGRDAREALESWQPDRRG